MAHYVMSDIHGEGARFDAMLEKIGFSGEDTLYILGDVIDRGPDGVQVLRYVLEQPNIHMLLGNHEQMCLEFFAPGAGITELLRWHQNGNEYTLQDLEQMTAGERKQLLTQLESLPDHMEITVDGRNFYLVHGFPGENTTQRVWGRPHRDASNPFPDCTLIVGHTPVMLYMESLEPGEHLRIFHAPGFIDIDCGCGHHPANRRLACLRLEDMAEFYT